MPVVKVKPRLIGWLAVATLVLMLAVAIEASGLVFDGQPWAAEQGFGAAPLLLVDLLLVVTTVFYMLAPIVPQNRLMLVQAIANALYGLGMIVGGILVALAGVATLFGLLTLLFAFPFGTIAYFVEFGCASQSMETPGWAVGAAGLMGEDCFDATRGAIVLGLALKVGGMAALLAAAFKFIKVRGLVILFLLSAALSAGLVLALIATGRLFFLLYPVDAVLTVIVGLVALIYGVVVAIKALFALAMAIAAQAA